MNLSEEFCAHEYFKPKCSNNEVIVMEKAIYGRMKLGRCLDMDEIHQSLNNTRSIGCSSDVLDILDERCSGLRTCNVQIMDPELIKRSTCYKGLMLYLEAKYSCYSVATSDQSCSITIGNEPSHISFMDSTHPSSPNICSSILFEASHGQTIIISIIEFHQKSKANQEGSSICNRGSDNINNGSIILGTFRNKDVSSRDDQRIHICSGGQRQRNVLASKTNKVEFEMAHNNNNRFILTFIATGCYDMKPPQDAWMKREGNEITVGCYMNRHTWKLVCNGRNWVGVIGNCTQLNDPNEMETANEADSRKDNNINQRAENVFLLLVLISLMMIVLSAASCIVLISYQKRNGLKKNKNIYIKDDFPFDVANGNHFLNYVNNDDKPIIKEDLKDKDSNNHGYYVLEGQTDEYHK